MLNTFLKISLKDLAAKLKSALPSLITSQQTLYVQNRYNGEAGRLISDILDISDKSSIDGYLLSTLLIIDFCWSFFKKMALVTISLAGSKYC